MVCFWRVDGVALVTGPCNGVAAGERNTGADAGLSEGALTDGRAMGGVTGLRIGVTTGNIIAGDAVVFFGDGGKTGIVIGATGADAGLRIGAPIGAIIDGETVVFIGATNDGATTGAVTGDKTGTTAGDELRLNVSTGASD
jgi:hypothetical protein